MATAQCDRDRRSAAASPAKPAPMMWIVPASDKCMPQSNPQQIRLIHANPRPWRRPAARYHALEHLAIDRTHDFRCAHSAAWRPGHDFIGLGEMPTGAFDNISTGSAEPRVRGTDLWITASDPGQRQCFSREIQASEIGILIDIPQDIGQLKCAAEMVSQGFPVAVIHTENANAQPPHRAGYTVAIKIKFAERWSADIRACVHLHA